MATLGMMDMVVDDDLPAEPEDEELEESESESEDLEEEEEEGTYFQFDDMDVLHHLLHLEPHPAPNATNTGGRGDDDPTAAAVAAALKETESDGRVCPICLLDDDDDMAAGAWKETACGHRFHGRCVEKWLRAKGSCPMCRRQLVTPPAAADRDLVRMVLYGEELLVDSPSIAELLDMIG